MLRFAVTTMSTAKSTNIDFRKYRTEELAQKIFDVLAIPRAIGSFATTLIRTLAITVVVFLVLIVVFDLTLLQSVGVFIYLLIASSLVGLLYGVVRLIHGAFKNIDDIANIIAQVSKDVTRDAQGLATGDAHLPAGTELFKKVYGEVFVPVLEEVVSNSFGLLKRPISWLYRQSIGAFVSRILIDVQMQEPENKIERDQVIGAMLTVSSNARTIEIQAEQVSDRVQCVARRIQYWFLLPLYLLLGVVLTAATVPLALLVHHWAGN